MANVSYDTLTIQINADSKEASKSIKTLSNNLNKLNETAKNLNTRRIGEIKGLLLNIAKIDFSNVSKGLQDIVSAFKYFQNKTAQTISPVFSTFNKGGNNMFSNISTYTKGLEKANYDFSKLGETGAVSTSKIDKNINKSAKNVKKLTDEVKKLEEKTKNVSSQFAKMFKNILKYRVVRKLIQSIFQEIQNAIGELANIDEDFNQSFGEIKSALSYVARVLVSVIAPIVKVIAPIITMIAQAIGEIGNALGSAFAGALGQDEFAQAEERVESYTESLNKAKGVATSFDKLNVISQEKSDGFSMTDVGNGSSKLSEAIENIKNVLQPLLQELAPQIAGLMVKVVSAIEKITPLLEVILGLVYDLVHLTDDSVNGSVGAFVDSLGSAFQLLGAIAKLLEPILKVLNFINAVVINIVNWVIEFLANGLSSVFEIISTLYQIIVAFFEGDIEKIEELWDNMILSLQKKWEQFGLTIANFFIKIWNNIVSFIEGVVNQIIDSINKIGKYTGGWSIPNVDFSGAKGQTFDVSGATSSASASFSNYQISNPNQNSNNNNNQEIVIELDGKEIARAVNKQNANRGSSFLSGGNINYGKGY